jgi:hypothetical protein
VSTQHPDSPDRPSVVPPEYTAIVDVAAIFPPGNAPLADAVLAFRGHRGGPLAELVGPFVVSDTRLPDLLSILDADPADFPLPVTVVVSGGAGAIEPAVRWSAGSALIEPHGFEIALRDLDDLAGAARRVVAAAADLGVEVPVYVEPPVAQAPDLVGSHGWLTALDEVANADLRLKLRTGGATADLFPSADALGTAIGAALDRELPFKCTAGLHHAIRHRAQDTGYEHHGFLNVLLATRATLDGEDAAAALEERDSGIVVARLRELGSDTLARTRRWFTSFGCCGVTEPFDDLVALGLVPSPG